MSPARLVLLAAVLLVAGAAAGRSETSWEIQNAAGLLAFEEGDHLAAARHFEAAYAAAEAGGVVDPKLGALLNNLAAAYLALGRTAAVGEALGRWAALLERNRSAPWAAAQGESLAAAVARLDRTPGASGRTGQSGRRYAVQLASLPTRAEAEAESRRLRQRYALFLGPRQTFTRKAEAAGRGSAWGLYAGPFGSAVTARNVCRYFERQQQGCLVVELTSGAGDIGTTGEGG